MARREVLGTSTRKTQILWVLTGILKPFVQAEAMLGKGVGAPSRGKQILALTLLNILLIIIGPFIYLKKLDRTLRKKSRHELDWRRWTVANVRPDVPLAPLSGPRVVLVGPTFGELRMMEVVTRQIKEHRPDVNIIWCLRDLATIDLLRSTHPDQAVTIWPFDNAFPVMKWARMVKPDVVVITEKFWLPNLVSISHLAGAKLALINGRTNRRDRITDRMKYSYYRWITHNFDVLCLQSPLFLDRLKDLIRPTTNTLITGNMKLDLEVVPIDSQREAAIKSWLSPRGDLPIFAAGSTATEVDEEFVFDAFAEVRKTKDCCLLIAPRKLSRAPETASAARARGYKVSMRSDPTSGRADVYVLDTLGELSHSYQYAHAAFIGGTIVSTGHNVIEPVLWGVAVAYGPLRGHFEDLQVLCEQFGVGFRCMNSGDLAMFWNRALTDDAFRADMKTKAQTMLSYERGATRKTVEALQPLIPGA